MPVLERIDWISRQFTMNRRGFISVGEAQDCNKLKNKITLEPPSTGSISASVLLGMHATLDAVRKLVVTSVATDRGHKFSDGRSVISIWIHQAPTGEQLEILPRVQEVAVSTSANTQAVLAEENDSSILPEQDVGTDRIAVESSGSLSAHAKMQVIAEYIETQISSANERIVEFEDSLPFLSNNTRTRAEDIIRRHAQIVDGFRSLRVLAQQILHMREGMERSTAIDTFFDQFMDNNTTFESDCSVLHNEIVQLVQTMQDERREASREAG